MVMNNLLRSYEVSIWTLQDSFITILKPSNLEHQGQIIEPNMTLKDDGENKFSFKIPMYISDNNGELIENPIWYNTKNGNIIANLRKIKVIFNKEEDFEEIFEFIIVNVEETHEGDKKICSVECESLAFHELGKQGYKISLNGQDDITNDQTEWNKNPIGPCPNNNINYWADKIFKGSNWRYSIQMDWSASDGISHEIYKIDEKYYDSDNYENFPEDIKNKFNILRAQKGLKRRDVIYEEEYVSSWHSSDDQTSLVPNSIQVEQEKYRLLESKESNRYNLSQSLAELFQVFCKYKYYYDDNYHIIDREVIFYNNFLNENHGIIDFTYKYNTNSLTRTMEGTDLVTKMFVPSIKDDNTEIGECSIMDTAANKSGEDYLLNFDYMYNIGTIDEEQYEEIEIYQTKLHDINENYNQIQENLNDKNNKLEKLKVKLQNAKDMCTVATERAGEAEASISKINEISKRTAAAPAFLMLKKKEGEQYYYCDFNDDGIIESTLMLYKNYDSVNHSLSNSDLITSYNKKYDDYGNLIGITGLLKQNDKSGIYGVYNFNPNLHYNNIKDTYGRILAQNTNIVNTLPTEIQTLENEIEKLEQQKENLITEKNNIISNFENLMGPALREGKWQPEDDYAGYGDLHENESYSIDMTSELNDEVLTSFGWDDELFDKEQKCYYEMGEALDKYYYPCIKITNELINIVGGGTVYDFINKSSFIYQSSITGNNNHHYMTIGSKMVLCFLKNNSNNQITPVLMLLGAKETASNETNAITNGKIGIISFEETIVESNLYTIKSADWVISPSSCGTPINGEPQYKVVYPRFFINSNTVKSPETMISIKQEDSLLEIYKDFYILYRYSRKPYITIKPEVFLRNGLKSSYNYSITYTISTAALAIYLDAVHILQENSCPKVSYEINISSLDENFIKNTYQRLGQIAHINDYEFKFENVLGYISELNLNLNKPWEDKVIIKNYKTKFEDLFSTIVAQTEQMKKNTAILNTAITYFGTNGSGGLINTLYEDLNNKVEELISPSVTFLLQNYANYEPFINAKLQQVFNEASQVINASQNTLEELNNLNIENSNILNLFKYNIKESMTGTLFEDNNSTNKYRLNTKLNALSTSFKKGDIWHHNNNYYVAIMSSDQVEYDNTENTENARLASLKGWCLTEYSSLSQIKGAQLDVNTTTGEINVAGQNVQITGSQNVSISGPSLNFNSLTTDNNRTVNSGIHMIATEIVSNTETQSTTVDITSDGITMAASNGIIFKSGKGINFWTSDNNNTSVLKIDKDEGIYLGSNKSIKFFSGNGINSNVSVEINNDKILFGVSEGKDKAAIKLTKEYIILSAGDIVNSNNSETINNIGINTSGIKITNNSIKMAVRASSTNISQLSITGKEITIANTNNESNGAFVSIGENGVFIGAGITNDDGYSNSSRTTMINNITTSTTAANMNNYNGAPFQVYTPNFIVTKEGKLYARDAYLAGTINAQAGNIGGWNIGSYYLGNTDNQNSSTVGIASKHTNGNSATYSFWAGGAYNATPTFSVTPNGYLRATSVRIGPDNSASYLIYNQNGLEVKGNIKATSGTIGGWTIGEHSIHIGENSNTTYIGDTNNSAAFSAGNGAFYVQHSGFLYAKNASIEGSVTATSGIIGGCNIEGGNLKVDSAHIISIDANKINAGTISVALNLSAATITGGSITGTTINNGNGTFYVDNNGSLIATSATIIGTVTATSGSFTGNIYAGGGTISGWNIDNNGIWKRVNGDHNLVGMMTWEGGGSPVSDNTQAFMAGDGRFYVTYGGFLHASGADIAGATTINTSGSVFIGNSDNYIKIPASDWSNDFINLGYSGEIILKTRDYGLLANSIEVESETSDMSGTSYDSAAIKLHGNNVVIYGNTIIDFGGGKRVRLYASNASASPPSKQYQENRILWFRKTGESIDVSGQTWNKLDVYWNSV